MTNILKVLLHRFGNVDFPHVNTQILHHHDGIVIRAVSSTKPRHGYTHDVFARIAQLIEGLDADKQGKRGIQSTTNAYDNLFAMGVNHTFCQAHHLNIENLLTTTSHILRLRNKWQWIKLTLKHKVAWRVRTAIRESNGKTRVFKVELQVALGIHVCGIGTTFRAQTFYIYLHGTHLVFHREPFALGKQFTILVNHRITTIHYILCTLAKTTTTIHISRNGTGTLLGNERLEVIVLANEFVAGREVEDNVCTSQCQRIAGRNRSPYVFTYLNAKENTVARTEELGIW